MNTQVETDKKGKKVAEHSWIDSAGNIVEEIENGTGCRYVDLQSGQTFDWQTGGVAGESITMKAMFGQRTLMTNEASAERQRDGSGAEQVEAIRERATMIDTTKVWVDRTREGGPRVDPEKAAMATTEFMVGAGKVADTDEAKAAAYASILAKFSDEKDGKAQISKAMTNADIAAIYKRLKGAKQATADDLAGLVG